MESHNEEKLPVGQSRLGSSTHLLKAQTWKTKDSFLLDRTLQQLLYSSSTRYYSNNLPSHFCLINKCRIRFSFWFHLGAGERIGSGTKKFADKHGLRRNAPPPKPTVVQYLRLINTCYVVPTSERLHGLRGKFKTVSDFKLARSQKQQQQQQQQQQAVAPSSAT